MLTEEQDGKLHLAAARYLLNQSLMVKWTESEIVPISEKDFEAAHAKIDVDYGRLHCWILFSVGAEYLIKGVLMTRGVEGVKRIV